MELFGDNIHECIFSFLSLKGKINAREVCTTFKRNIKTISILIQKMDRMIERNQSLEKKISMEMMLIAPNIYVPYNSIERHGGVHALYRQNRYSIKEKCIVDRCREKRLGYIYNRLISTSDMSSQHYYIKRKVGYCSQCFNIWHRV